MADAASDPKASAIGQPAARALRRRRSTLDDRQLRDIGLTVLAAAALTLLTIVAFNYLPRYEMPGQDFMDNADFRDGFEGWEIGGIVTLDEVEVGLATLQNRDPDDFVYLRRTLELPPGQTSLLLSADVATDEVRGGEERWAAARIYLVQQTDGGDYVWNQPHMLVELVGTARRHHVEDVFEIPASIDRVTLGIELAHATGQFEVANLRLARLDELPAFRLVATLLVAGWCVLIVRVGWSVMRSIALPKVRALLVITVALLVAGTFMPATLRQHLLDSLASGFGLHGIDPAALGHAAVFALLALFVRSGRPRDPLLLHLSCWALAGAAAEVLQLLTVDRSPSGRDWLADLVGVMIGLTLAEIGLVVERLLRPARKRRSRVGFPHSDRPSAWPGRS